MKIDSSFVGMESARRYTSRTQRNLGYSLNTSLKDAGSTGEEKESFSDIFGIKNREEESVRNHFSTEGNTRQVLLNKSISSVEEHKALEKIKAQCMQYLIFLLFGGQSRKNQFEEMMKELRGQTDAQTVAEGSMNGPMTLKATASTYFEEQETTAFSTMGTVKTADGREINFQLDLTMSRSFQEYYETNYTQEMVKMIDPLVINLDSNIATLSDQKFEFDLDADGVKDTISMLNQGSGYLALDKNEDGMINDGSELFGTRSGDGFQDLATYDLDGNGWIDENDEIFDKLLIWSKNERGEDELYTLKEAGVGAICLRKASTDFSLNNLKNNQTNGAIRNTGVFLYENGNVGTIQHIDLVR